MVVFLAWLSGFASRNSVCRLRK